MIIKIIKKYYNKNKNDNSNDNDNAINVIAVQYL